MEILGRISENQTKITIHKGRLQHFRDFRPPPSCPQYRMKPHLLFLLLGQPPSHSVWMSFMNGPLLIGNYLIVDTNTTYPYFSENL